MDGWMDGWMDGLEGGWVVGCFVYYSDKLVSHYVEDSGYIICRHD